MSQYTRTELEELEAVLVTQALLAVESVDTPELLGDEFDKNARFQKPTTVNKTEQRERERIPETSTKYCVVRKRLSSLD